jgi:hypothetical protein
MVDAGLVLAALPLISVSLRISPLPSLRPSPSTNSVVRQDALGYTLRCCCLRAECCCSKHVAICLLAARRGANRSSSQPGYEVHASSSSNCWWKCVQYFHGSCQRYFANFYVYIVQFHAGQIELLDCGHVLQSEEWHLHVSSTTLLY